MATSASYNVVTRPVGRSWSLSGQFAMAGGQHHHQAAALAGLITSGIVTRATVENTATSTALFMDSFLSPHLQELATSDALSPEASVA